MRTQFKGVEHLPPMQERLLAVLMCHRYVTLEIMQETLWPDPDLMPDTWYGCFKTYLHYLRKAIRPAGWEVIYQLPKYDFKYWAITLERLGEGQPEQTRQPIKHDIRRDRRACRDSQIQA